MLGDYQLLGTFPALRPIVAALGFSLTLWMFVEGFESLVLPHRVDRKYRLTRFYYRNMWRMWRTIGRNMKDDVRDTYFAVFAPLSLLIMLSLWAIGMVAGFGLFFWAIDMPVTSPEKIATLDTYLYFSATTFVTLGYGDVVPVTHLARILANIEAGMGFGFLALVIAYLPVLYGAFSRREGDITMLDARASSPPSAGELLIRHKNNLPELAALLRDWERWAADFLESHLSYPVLCYYRSQHEKQSWINSITTILDACAFIIAASEDLDENDPLLWQARLTFAICRHAAVDIALVFAVKPKMPPRARLCDENMDEFIALFRGSSLPEINSEKERQRLFELNGLYEPYVDVLSHLLLLPLPNWMPTDEHMDNWKTSSWDRSDHFFYRK